MTARSRSASPSRTFRQEVSVHLRVERRVVEVLVGRAAHDVHPDAHRLDGLELRGELLGVAGPRAFTRRGHARAQELGRAQRGGGARLRRRHRARRGDVEPQDHRQLLGDEAAHEGLRHVRVRVDQAGQHDGAGPVDQPVRPVTREHRGAIADVHDVTVADDDGAVGPDGAARIHRDHVTGHDHVGPRGRAGPGVHQRSSEATAGTSARRPPRTPRRARGARPCGRSRAGGPTPPSASTRSAPTACRPARA